MRRFIKNIIAIFLVAVWLLPSGIKLADSVFHEHDDFTCNAGANERHFHILHDNCLIPFIAQSVCVYNSYEPQIIARLFSEHVVSPVCRGYDIGTFSFFSLRAPPVLSL